MGLIRAGLNAVGGTLASQWKEYFYLDAMPEGVLAAKANKKTKGRFGGSRNEDDNIISAGSTSPYSLYSKEYVTFGEDEVYNQADAQGFINLFGLPLTVRALMKQGKLK